MAGVIDLPISGSLKILDPGAGTGLLSAALCERIAGKTGGLNLEIHAFETDKSVAPILARVLSSCKYAIAKAGSSLKSTVLQTDFILRHAEYLEELSLFAPNLAKSGFDIVVMNPPYFKLSRTSRQALAAKAVVYGQPNIYALFIAIGIALLRDGGQMVFISPRSFCSGLYFSRLREWMLERTELKNIHLFDSRRRVFDQDGILQESVIFRIQKSGIRTDPRGIRISSSPDRRLRLNGQTYEKPGNVVHRVKSRVFIRIPTNGKERSAIKEIESWPNTLDDLRLRVSTGPVVAFRAWRHLAHEFREGDKHVPLLWMHNLRRSGIEWPVDGGRKPAAIAHTRESEPLLVPLENCVLVKRFTSKEQSRRVHASALLRKDFPFRWIGI